MAEKLAAGLAPEAAADAVLDEFGRGRAREPAGDADPARLRQEADAALAEADQLERWHRGKTAQERLRAGRRVEDE